MGVVGFGGWVVLRVKGRAVEVPRGVVEEGAAVVFGCVEAAWEVLVLEAVVGEGVIVEKGRDVTSNF